MCFEYRAEYAIAVVHAQAGTRRAGLNVAARLGIARMRERSERV
jgi:hypothetical protein